MDVSRRSLLKAVAAGLSGAVGMAAHPSSQPSPVGRRWGVQLYTVRARIGADAAAALKQIAAIGYKDLEVLQPTLTTVAPIAASLGLTIASVHLDAATAKGDGLEVLLADARRLGIGSVVVPFVPPAERPTDRAGFDALAARLSRMARAANAAGLQLSYHNHAFEFGQDRDGTRWLDVLMRGTADAGLQLQLDVFWATIAGADAVALLRQYKGRVASLHLKDKDPKAGTTLTESAVPRTAFAEVGSGSIDFPAILAAAREAGVRHCFVEQDVTPGDPMDSLSRSYEYLARLPPP